MSRTCVWNVLWFFDLFCITNFSIWFLGDRNQKEEENWKPKKTLTRKSSQREKQEFEPKYEMK